MIEVNGRRKARTFSLAEGRLWPVPPCPSQKIGRKGGDSAKNERLDREPLEDLCEKTEVSLDWQGEVKCGPEVRFGGFLTSHVSIKVRIYAFAVLMQARPDGFLCCLDRILLYRGSPALDMLN
jgi:hypothetical protein